MSRFCGVFFGKFWQHLQRFWATSSMAGAIAGLEIWLVLQEEDTILLVYEFLEARLCAVRFIFLVCNKLMWPNLIEGRKIGVLRPIGQKLKLIFFSGRALLLAVLKSYITSFSTINDKKQATMVEVQCTIKDGYAL